MSGIQTLQLESEWIKNEGVSSGSWVPHIGLGANIWGTGKSTDSADVWTAEQTLPLGNAQAHRETVKWRESVCFPDTLSLV